MTGRPRRARRRICVTVAASFVALSACSGGDDSGSDESAGPDESTADEADASPPTTESATPPTTEAAMPSTPLSPEDRDEALIATFEALRPEPSTPDAARPCEQFGFACSPAEASREQIDRGVDLLNEVDAAAAETDDGRDQLALAMAVVEGAGDLTYLDVDLDRATIFTFAVGDGPAMSFVPVGGLMQEIDQSEGTSDGEPEDDASTPEAGLVRPHALRSAPVPEGYRPVGGPTNPRSAAILNPMDWDVDDIVDTFRQEEQYTTVNVFNGSAVNPNTIATLGSYDAVHIFSHGGGSCSLDGPQPSGCSSALVGGPVGDIDAFASEYAAGDTSFGFSFCTASGSDVLRFCFDDYSVPTNPDGLQFFAVCGSSFGFSDNGSGASVTWDGTTQQRVASRTGTEFWRLMITEGIEFDLAKDLIKDNNFDSHQLTYWASGGDVLATTSSVWAGSNIRGRDVIEPKFDGQDPLGQVVWFEGIPGDAQTDTLPTADQEFTIRLDGVQTGTESRVSFEVYGDGTKWNTDIDLQRDGRAVDGGERYNDWIVTVNPEEVEISDVSVSSVGPSSAPTELEVRAFESSSEYTAHLGSIRLATKLTTSGKIPIFETLESATAGVAKVEGNDLQLRFDTEGGTMEGDIRVTIEARGAAGFWDGQLDGTYDADAGTMSGDFEGTAAGGALLIGVVGEQASGTFDGTVDLNSGIVQLTLSINGQTQNYVGTIVE